MISKAELMHHRLQAWLREWETDEVEYLGYKPDILGQMNHWYRFGEHEVTVDCIEDFDMKTEEHELT